LAVRLLLTIAVGLSQAQGADGDGIPDFFQGKAILQQGAPPTDDIARKLQKLKQLRDAGLITSQEYEEKKAEILSDL